MSSSVRLRILQELCSGILEWRFLEKNVVLIFFWFFQIRSLIIFVQDCFFISYKNPIALRVLSFDDSCRNTLFASKNIFMSPLSWRLPRSCCFKPSEASRSLYLPLWLALTKNYFSLMRTQMSLSKSQKSISSVRWNQNSCLRSKVKTCKLQHRCVIIAKMTVSITNSGFEPLKIRTTLSSCISCAIKHSRILAQRSIPTIISSASYHFPLSCSKTARKCFIAWLGSFCKSNTLALGPPI